MTNSRHMNTIYMNHTSYAKNTKINHAIDNKSTKIVKDIIANNKPSKTVFEL